MTPGNPYCTLDELAYLAPVVRRSLGALLAHSESGLSAHGAVSRTEASNSYSEAHVAVSLRDDGRFHPDSISRSSQHTTGSWLAVAARAVLERDAHTPYDLLDVLEGYHREHTMDAEAVRDFWRAVPLSHHATDSMHSFDAPPDCELIPISVHEMVEATLLRLELAEATPGFDVPVTTSTPLHRLLPRLEKVSIVDPGVESTSLDSGKWLSKTSEDQLVAEAFANQADAAVFPYGVFRLTRTEVDTAWAADTWPLDTEIWLPAGEDLEVVAPVDATVVVCPDADRQVMTLYLSEAWRLIITGAQSNVEAGAVVFAGQVIARLPASESRRSLVVGMRRTDAPEASTTSNGVVLVAPERVPVWQRLTHDPAVLLGLESRAQHDESRDEVVRRDRVFASAQERYYANPMQIQRGWRHHLIDTTGRAYVDMVNNVTGVGHGHPGVADAVNRQIRTLGTNSRFLYREVADYSERVIDLLPAGSGLDTVLLVNSGSEAVDLALRLAQAATGRKSFVALREAYHGWTMASDAVTTSAYDNPYALENRPAWVHVADVPNRFRGTYRGRADDTSVGAAYVADLTRDIDNLARQGRPIAGFICESVLGNSGGVLLPDGYLAQVYDVVRAAGGVCIADEVQVGFGRLGSSFWGFEQSAVMPDLITIAKPMGNGFPVGGVITSRRIADALATQGPFFASTGGNPVSCAVGLAVLDAIRDEELQANARRIGGVLLEGFSELGTRHELIGPIHGAGLYLGVELVRDRNTMEPATAEAIAICERLRELGVVVLTTSERSNVLKVKPPLCLTVESAEFMLTQLDRVLTEGW